MRGFSKIIPDGDVQLSSARREMRLGVNNRAWFPFPTLGTWSEVIQRWDGLWMSKFDFAIYTGLENYY